MARGNTLRAGCVHLLLCLSVQSIAQVRGDSEQCEVVPGQWNLVFEDQFPLNPATETGLDADVWTFDVGTRDMSDPDNPGPELWGNGEPQYYTDRAENAKVVELGPGGTTALQIAAKKELYEGLAYTSARVVSKTHPIAGQIMPPKHANGSFVDGGGVRVEVRVHLPEGDKTGTWPAVWMLPTKPAYGLWPFSGEIDVVESKSSMAKVITGIHFGGPWTHSENLYKYCKCSATIPPNPKDCPGIPLDTACKEGFKTWAMEWTVKYVDGEPTMNIAWFQNGWKIHSRDSSKWWSNKPELDAAGAPEKLDNPLAPFDQPFYIIMNIAVGGYYFAGFPPEGAYDQKFLIEYVKIFEKT